MIGCGGRQTRELQIDRDGARSKGGPNPARNPLGRSKRVGRPSPFWAGSGPSSSPRLILAFWTFPLDLCHFEVVIPAIKIGDLLV
jgi:hypothetical protein